MMTDFMMTGFFIETATKLPKGQQNATTWVLEAAYAVVDFLESQKMPVPEFLAGEEWTCGFRLADDAEVQQLNKQFRDKDKPTNVLSFPADLQFPDPDEPLYIGDIIFAMPTVLREAAEQGKTFEHHLKHLTLHGLLHLFGYDHIEDTDAEIMENLEITLLDALKIKNPYNSES